MRRSWFTVGTGFGSLGLIVFCFGSGFSEPPEEQVHYNDLLSVRGLCVNRRIRQIEQTMIVYDGSCGVYITQL